VVAFLTQGQIRRRLNGPKAVAVLGSTNGSASNGQVRVRLKVQGRDPKHLSLQMSSALAVSNVLWNYSTALKFKHRRGGAVRARPVLRLPARKLVYTWNYLCT
jgi:hypothetical protein